MSDWQSELNLKDVWECGNVHAIALTASQRLKAMNAIPDVYLEEERINIADEFFEIAQDKSAGTSDFDDVMCRLYDWADARLDDQWNGKKVCWVSTF